MDWDAVRESLGILLLASALAAILVLLHFGVFYLVFSLIE